MILSFLEVIAQIVAALAAVAALMIAKQANRLAETTASESNRLAMDATKKSAEHAYKAEQREIMRDQREIASNLQAWWVCTEQEDAKKWGILISTTGANNSVFYEVVLHVLVGGQEITRNIAMLPPGKYFVESVRSSNYFLSNPQPISSLDRYQPLLQAERYAVEAIEFKDQIGQKWRWSRDVGLQAIS